MTLFLPTRNRGLKDWDIQNLLHVLNVKRIEKSTTTNQVIFGDVTCYGRKFYPWYGLSEKIGSYIQLQTLSCKLFKYNSRTYQETRIF